MPTGEIRNSVTKEPGTLKTKGGKGGEPTQVKFAKGRSGAKNTETPALRRMEIEPSDNGGHTVTHHYVSSGSMDSYREPETHAFGHKEGAKVIKHIKKHLGLSYSDATGSAVNHEEPNA